MAFSPPKPPLSCSSVLPKCSIHQKQEAVGGKGPWFVVCKMESLLSLFFFPLCFCLPLFFCILIFLYPSLRFLSLFFPLSSTISWRFATLFNLMACWNCCWCCTVNVALVPPLPPSLYSAASTLQPRIIPSAWSSFLPL